MHLKKNVYIFFFQNYANKIVCVNVYEIFYGNYIRLKNNSDVTIWI